MCERAPLFLHEAKSILYDLLKRTLELFDLSLYFVEYYHLNRFLFEREQKRHYYLFSIYKPCKLNYNMISDLNIYLNRLYTTCRLTKSHLRSLHATRTRLLNDYIVIDDEIYELINYFQLKINKLCHEFQSKVIKTKQSDQITSKRYHSQRTINNSQPIQSFIFLPETLNQKNNSENTIVSSNDIQLSNSQQIKDYHYILILFQKISQFYQLLIQQLYGIHIVQDSDILQPIVISIIQLLLLITNKLKYNIEILSPTKTNRNHFSVQKDEEICHSEKTKKISTKTKFNLIEIHPENIIKEKNDKNVEYVRNDNHSLNVEDDQISLLDFDEDEFYRLANLERDD